MTESKKGRELFRRYVLFIISLFISALGIAFTKRGEMGVSPISSVANVLSLKFTNLTMGNWLIIWNCVLILGQIVILRKNFKLIQLLQIPLSFLFGYFTDIGVWVVSLFEVGLYWQRFAMVIIGTVILGFGISLAVIANVVMNAGEAFVAAVAGALHRDFGNVKICFDVFCVASSVVLSLIFFNFTIVGAREGTLIAALGTGVVVKFFTKLLKECTQRLLVR